MINNEQVLSTQTEMKSNNVFKENWLKIISVLASFVILAGFFLIYQNSQKTQVTSSPSPSTVPYYQLESFKQARDKVIFSLPYTKKGIKIEYFAKAEAFLTTIEATDINDYRHKKQEAEKFLASLGANICDLHMGWSPRVNFKQELTQEDGITSGC